MQSVCLWISPDFLTLSVALSPKPEYKQATDKLWGSVILLKFFSNVSESFFF